MTNASKPSYVYGESYPIAMDAALVTRAPQKRTDVMRRTIALDTDTALEDGQWEKLKEHLSGKLSPEDMNVVENICRKGGDAPEPGEDRRRVSGAADALVHHPGIQHRARAMAHRQAGITNDAAYERELMKGPKVFVKPEPVAYDRKSFPNSGRLK